MSKLAIPDIKPLTNQIGEQFYPKTTTDAVFQPDSETGHETTLTQILESKADAPSSVGGGNFLTYNEITNQLEDSGYNKESFATASQGTKADTAYQKQQAGIPESDLASDVQTSLHKADTALQQHQDISGKVDKVANVQENNFAIFDENGGIKDSTYNATNFAPIAQAVPIPQSGDEGKILGYETQGGVQWVNQQEGVGFQTITTQQDGTMVITLTNGDTITIDLNHQHPNYYSNVAETTQPSGGMLPDVTYKLGTLTGATTFLFASAVSGNVNHYYFTFTSGSTAVVPTWPASITSWDGNCVDSTTGLPVIAANKTYEVSVLDGNAIIKEW